jgi:hypothetical protein
MTVGGGGDGADRDRLEGDVSQPTLPRLRCRCLLCLPLFGVCSNTGAGVGRREGVIGRQVVVGFSLLPNLRIVDDSGDGSDRDRLAGDVSQLSLPPTSGPTSASPPPRRLWAHRRRYRATSGDGVLFPPRSQDYRWWRLKGN